MAWGGGGRHLRIGTPVNGGRRQHWVGSSEGFVAEGESTTKNWITLVVWDIYLEGEGRGGAQRGSYLAQRPHQEVKVFFIFCM
jgi:hypothetical protein